MQHAGQLYVVDVATAAAHEAGILLAEHPAVADRLQVVVGGLEVLKGLRALGRGVVDGGHNADSTLSWAAAAAAASCRAAHWIDRTMVV